jgi:dolichol-phosphate mannosyltransferase
MNDISEHLLIIIPTYNEVHNINKLLRKIRKFVPDCGILVVDDNSPDGTSSNVKNMQKQDKNIYLVQRDGKLGLASARTAGLKWGLDRGYEYLCEMDADLSHNPIYLKKFIEEITEYDFIIGSRYIQNGGVLNWPLRRKILSKIGNSFSRLILSTPIHDFTGGFNMWRKQVLENMDLDEIESEGFSFHIELKYKAYKKGFSFKEVPIIFEERVKDASKMSKKIIFEAFWRVLLFRLWL